MARKSVSADQILETALVLADKASWESVRLHDVATSLGISLEAVQLHFREKEDLVDAWFDRADRAMLKDAAKEDFQHLDTRERLHRLMMARFDALSEHKRVTREMILGKMEFGHLHVQIPALLRVSRTVQWMREAAERKATFIERALEETALTSLFLATTLYWLQDHSDYSEETGAFLKNRLSEASTASFMFNHWICEPVKRFSESCGICQ